MHNNDFCTAATDCPTPVESSLHAATDCPTPVESSLHYCSNRLSNSRGVIATLLQQQTVQLPWSHRYTTAATDCPTPVESSLHYCSNRLSNSRGVITTLLQQQIVQLPWSHRYTTNVHPYLAPPIQNGLHYLKTNELTTEKYTNCRTQILWAVYN